MKHWRLAAADTHLYPGARLRCLEAAGEGSIAAGDPAHVEFSDGVVVAGRFDSAAAAEAVLWVDAYATLRGAKIPAKRWRVVPTAATGQMRVNSRA
ncbi:MAG: hypothetical protein K0Q43_4859 [Ramlibacter sp.]|nr:hypothetical protein [Ramlibacter sp.]MDF2466624.1 hypothetical protein [Ramlibacter sp.]